MDRNTCQVWKWTGIQAKTGTGTEGEAAAALFTSCVPAAGPPQILAHQGWPTVQLLPHVPSQSESSLNHDSSQRSAWKVIVILASSCSGFFSIPVFYSGISSKLPEPCGKSLCKWIGSFARPGTGQSWNQNLNWGSRLQQSFFISIRISSWGEVLSQPGTAQRRLPPCQPYPRLKFSPRQWSTCQAQQTFKPLRCTLDPHRLAWWPICS